MIVIDVLILLCSFLCIAQSKLPLKGTITYHQSICKCFGQCEYDEHEGMSFMKKKKKKENCGWTIPLFFQVFMATVVGMFTAIHPFVGHWCQSAVILVHTHKITIPYHPMCCPMSDLSTVCIFFSLCTLFFEGSSDINYTDKNPKVSARSWSYEVYLYTLRLSQRAPL